MHKKERTSRQLVLAAFGLFARHGIEKTSLAMIAKEVGMTKPSIYYHFESKEQLVQAVFDFLFADYQFARYFALDIVRADDFVRAVYEGGLRMLPEDDEEHDAVLRVLHEFMLHIGREHSYAAQIVALQQQFLDGFEALLRRGVELGVVEDNDVKERAHLLALVIDNLSSYMMMRISVDHRGIWRAAVERVLGKGAALA